MLVGQIVHRPIDKQAQKLTQVLVHAEALDHQQQEQELQAIRQCKSNGKEQISTV